MLDKYTNQLDCSIMTETFRVIFEEIISETFKATFLFIRNELQKKLSSSQKDIEATLLEHFIYIDNWSKDITFKDLKSPKSLLNVYIRLNMHFLPKRQHFNTNEALETKSIEDIIYSTNNHIIVLGQPGAGKTTTMQQVCQSILFNENYSVDVNYIPIVVRFRDLNTYKNAFSIYRILYSIFALKITEIIHNVYSKQDDETTVYEDDLIKKVVVKFLNSGKFIVILDGYDEIPNIEYKEKITDEIRELFLKVTNSKFILTSRSSDFSSYHIENSTVYEICSLNSSQINTYTAKWFNNATDAEKFRSEMIKSPFNDTLIRPLFLSHLCAIFERSGYIPEKPQSVYAIIIGLLLRDWDQQRSIRRVSGYAGFEVDRKERFLAHLASELTIKKQKTAFNVNDLQSVYRSICSSYNLPPNQAEDVINELESHNGIFIQSGWDEFSFSHKSFQEYLTAKHMIGLPRIPEEKSILSKIPNELAISVALSTDSNLYFCEIVLRLMRVNVQNLHFFKIFLERLYIEKPDFIENVEIGMAFAYLQTIFISSQEYDETDVEEIFEEYFKIKSVKKSISKILFYYSIIRERRATTIYKFQLTRLTDSNVFHFSYPLETQLTILRKYLD